MIFTQKDPIKIYVQDYTQSEYDELYKCLSYKDNSADHQIRNLISNSWFKKSMGEAAFNQRIQELKAQANQVALFQDEKGVYVLSGLKSLLIEKFPTATMNVDYKTVEPKLIPWSKVPDFKLRPYQEDSVKKMFGVCPSNTELATGAGKTAVILHLAKELGLKTLIVAPSTNIATAIYKLFLKHFPQKNVGFFGGSKKQTDKLFTIAIAQSLIRLKPGTDEWNELSTCDAFMFDECHLVAANTFFAIATGVAARATHRYFCFSPPERNDGKDLLLQSIIGETVVRKSIRDLIDEGYLAKINTIIFDVESDDTYSSTNAMKMNQNHLYDNKKIRALISNMTQSAYNHNCKTLVLIDEHDQEKLLQSDMKIPYEYASGLSDTNKIIDDFNSGKAMCVIGTSAVSIGSDFKSNQITIN